VHSNTAGYDAADTLAIIMHFYRERALPERGIAPKIIMLNGEEFLHKELRNVWVSRRNKCMPNTDDNALSVFGFREFGAFRKSDALTGAIYDLFKHELLSRLPGGTLFLLLPKLADHFKTITADDHSYRRFHLREELKQVAAALFRNTRSNV
jgi:hypothetical protein